MGATAIHPRADIALCVEKHPANRFRAGSIVLGGDKQRRAIGQTIDQCRLRFDAAVIETGRKGDSAMASHNLGAADQGDVRADAAADDGEAVLAAVIDFASSQPDQPETTSSMAASQSRVPPDSPCPRISILSSA